MYQSECALDDSAPITLILTFDQRAVRSMVNYLKRPNQT